MSAQSRTAHVDDRGSGHQKFLTIESEKHIKRHASLRKRFLALFIASSKAGHSADSQLLWAGPGSSLPLYHDQLFSALVVLWYWEISFVNFIHFWIFFAACQTDHHCPKCESSIHRSQKKRCRSLLQKFLFAAILPLPLQNQEWSTTQPITPQFPSQDTRLVVGLI